jgi:hypothetical protein
MDDEHASAMQLAFDKTVASLQQKIEALESRKLIAESESAISKREQESLRIANAKLEAKLEDRDTRLHRVLIIAAGLREDSDR